MTKCPSCSHENAEGIQYCDECGGKIEAHATVATATMERPASTAEKAAGKAGSSSGGNVKPAKLVITRGGNVGKEFPLEASETHVGRWDPDGGAFPEVDLTSDDPEAKISRKHARIFVQDGEYLVEDLGSLNGTYVNRGPRLLPGSPAPLKHDDEVVMGKTFFKFTIG